jgi:eukaryotic-like serine/threonine-protein kinase
VYRGHLPMSASLVRTADGTLHFVSDQASLDDLILAGKLERDSQLYQLADPIRLDQIPELTRLFEAADRARRASTGTPVKVQPPQASAALAAPALPDRASPLPGDDLAELDLPAPPSRAPKVALSAALVAVLVAVGFWLARGRAPSHATAAAPIAPAAPAPAPAAQTPPAPEIQQPTPVAAAPLPQTPSPQSDDPQATAKVAPAPAVTRGPETKPESPRATRSYAELVEEGSRLMEKGRTRQAQKLFEQALGSEPNGVDALTGLGYASLDLGSPARALRFFQSAVRAEPKHAPALLGLGEAYKEAGQTTEAIQAFNDCLARAPGTQEAGAAERQMKELSRPPRTP